MDALAGQGRWLPIVLVAVCALPVGAVVARLLAGWRMRRGLGPAEAWRRSLAEVGMVVGTAPWLWMILTPLPDEGLVHLIPFRDLAGQFEHPLLWVGFQIGGNLLVFAAYGLLAPIRWPIRPLWVVITAAAGSATVEFLQWGLALGRVASVDDVLINATGAGLFALCSRRWWRVRDPRTTGPGA